MKKIAKVGISVFTYNQGDFLEQAISSLKNQTFQDFDVYILDDCSDDYKTAQIIKNLKYNKIKKITIHAKNKGLTLSREESYKYIKNQYILDFDGDDMLAPTFLEECVNYLDSHPKCAAVSTNFRSFTNTPDDFFYEHHYDEKKMSLPYLLSNCYVLGSSLMRQTALEKIKWHGGTLKTCPDWDRWIYMAECGYKFGLINKPLFYYRQTKKSLSNSTNADKYYQTFLEIYKRHKKTYGIYIDRYLDNMLYEYAQLLEGKQWLDWQYKTLLQENKELRTKANYYEKPINSIKHAIILNWRKIHDKRKKN